MPEKRRKSQKRMQTQAKPSNRSHEKNMVKTINTLQEAEEHIQKNNK